MKIKLGFLAMLLVACVSCGYGRKFDTERVADIKNGTTTRAEIVEWFGKPYTQSTGTASGKPVLTYLYQHAKAGFYGAGSSSKMLSVEFDENDVVKTHSLTVSGTAAK